MRPECCGRQGLGHDISKVVVGGDMLEVKVFSSILISWDLSISRGQSLD